MDKTFKVDLPVKKLPRTSEKRREWLYQKSTEVIANGLA